MPGLHEEKSLQALFPDWSWYCVVPSHAVISLPFGHLKPAGQPEQTRGEVDVPLKERYCVALQVACGTQLSASVLELYVVVPSQGAHWRSDVAVGALDTKLPGAHVRQAVLTRSTVEEPTKEAKRPATHGVKAVHVSAFSVALKEVVPSQAAHTRPDVAVGACDLKLALQTRTALHSTLPSSGWNSVPGAHAGHAVVR